MSGIFGIVQTGKQALQTQMKAIEVTGHNIANVNTPGFTRQRVNLVTTPPTSTSVGMIGTGVTTETVERIYDRYLDNQVNNETEDLGRWEAQKSAIERVEIVLNEASDYGLNQAMSEFWNAWQDLANNPSGYVERVSLLGKSETMAYQFQQTYDAFSPIQSDLDASIAGAVDEINLKAAEIAALNEKIVSVEAGNVNANDYRDVRDLALKDLSLMIDITSTEESNGSIIVRLGDGNSLVAGNTSADLSTINNVVSGRKDVVWDTAQWDSLNDSITGGKLKGWIEVRDVIVPDYEDKLEELAEGIKTELNALHGDGFDLDEEAGGDFFAGTLLSGTFAVDTTISTDVNKIAASGTVDGAPGDNSNAINIAELQNALKMSGDTATFDDYYNSMISDVGIKAQQSAMKYNHQTAMITYLDNYRESISGVSLDEEMVNLIQFQHGYDAAAKLISTADELLQTLINMV